MPENHSYLLDYSGLEIGLKLFQKLIVSVSIIVFSKSKTDGNPPQVQQIEKVVL